MLNTMNINWIDVVLLAILGLTIVRGLMRGFIRSIFDILALAIAIYCAFAWYESAAVYMIKYFKIPGNIAIISFIAIWIIAYCVTLLTGNIAHKIFGRGLLGPINVLGGGLIGLAKGLLIIWFFISLISIFPLPKNIAKPIYDSITIKTVNPIFKQIKKSYPKIMPNSLAPSKKIDIKKGSVGI
jgi:membrane protein required for colicin V production